MNKGILHDGPKAQDKEDAKNHGLQDSHVHLVYWAFKSIWVKILATLAESRMLAREERP